MDRLVEVTVSDERFANLAGFPLDAGVVTRQGPDALAVLRSNRGVEGRCSVWWKLTPPLDGRRIGFVGHFAVVDPSAASELLSWACGRLEAEGCTAAIGPVDGNTWQRYRLITERGDEPPFFLEPDNPDDWAGLFVDAGFAALAQYYSALNTTLAAPDARLAQLAQRLHDAGFVFRSLNVDRFEEEMRRVHRLSLLAFRNNFLYTPISEEDFLAQYAGIRRFVRPDVSLVAENRGQLAGYLFAFPDLLRAQRGELMDTVIMKTMAVHPDHEGQGLGTLLMARSQEAARQAGFTRAIHALFHESNRSGKISGHTARIFRRYTLFARPLGAGR